MKNPWAVLRGRERLSIVFWVYCVPATVAFVAMPNIDEYPALKIIPWDDWIRIAIVWMLFLLLAHIALWTCAFGPSMTMETVVIEEARPPL